MYLVTSTRVFSIINIKIRGTQTSFVLFHYLISPPEGYITSLVRSTVAALLKGGFRLDVFSLPNVINREKQLTEDTMFCEEIIVYSVVFNYKLFFCAYFK